MHAVNRTDPGARISDMGEQPEVISNYPHVGEIAVGKRWEYVLLIHKSAPASLESNLRGLSARVDFDESFFVRSPAAIGVV